MRLVAGSVLILLCCALALSSTPAVAKRTPRAGRNYQWHFLGTLQPGFQSNVFKAPHDSGTKDDNLYAIGFDARLRRKFGRALRLEFKPDAEFDLYSRYSQRNQTKVDGRLELTWFASHHWRIRSRGDIERANRDLIDDSGQFSGRTLAKWVSGFSPEVRFRNHWLRADLRYERTFSNYDEATDTLGRPMISYDYDEHTLESGWHLEPSRWVELRLTYHWDWRDYRERRTLSIDKKNSNVRSFEEWTTTPQITIFTGWVEPYVRYSHTLRTDAYENFYGYTYDRIELGLRADPSAQLGFAFSIEYKEKHYPSYWTRRIGSAHRVAIQYRDWRLKADYLLSNRFNLVADVRWYVKTSNDPYFDYRQLSAFAGVELTLFDSR